VTQTVSGIGWKNSHWRSKNGKDNPDTLESLFREQFQVYDSVNSLYFGSSKNEKLLSLQPFIKYKSLH
jgi:hypothetical protein